MHKIRFVILLYVFGWVGMGMMAQGVVINEVVADNTWGALDEDGDASDWVELYNATGGAVDVGGMGLSDEEGNGLKWVFPSREIEAWGYLVVFASGKDRLDEGELHANFSVNADGERLWLMGADGAILDVVEEVELCNDRSYGRLPDGGEWKMLEIPSFEGTNDINDLVSSSYNSGYYNENLEVELWSEMGDDIYFTLNGSVPTTVSYLYTEGIEMYDRDEDPNMLSEIKTTPIDDAMSYPMWASPEGFVDKGNVLRFCSFRDGVRRSAVETRTYFVDENIFDKYSMPILSIVAEKDDFFGEETGIYVPGNLYDDEDPLWTGNYYQDGELWERDVHIEFFKRDGTLGFAQNAGVRIHGGITRSAAQKSLKFYARSEYNKRMFEYPLLPHKEFTEYKRFILGTSMGEGGGQY